jgi:plastocyanin
MKRRVVTVVGSAVAVSLLPLLPSPPARAQTASVSIVNFSYDPNPITIPVGGTVTWVNQDTAPHTATEDHNAWTSPVLNTGDSYSHTFTQPGTYTYYCVIHPGTMHGSIVVGGAVTATPQPTATAQSTVIPGTPIVGTATPSPTNLPAPTATATSIPYPDASRLYQGSLQALSSTSGYRISETATETGGTKRTFRLKGNVSSRSKAERLTLNVTGRAKQRTELLQIRTHAWIRRASVDRGWKRVVSSRVNKTLSPLRNPLTGQSGVRVANMTTVGPDSFAGAPVWHIRWTETSGPLSGTVDAMVGQKDSLPYLTIRSLKNSSTGTRLEDRITRSRFGEKLTIKEPKG